MKYPCKFDNPTFIPHREQCPFHRHSIGMSAVMTLLDTGVATPDGELNHAKQEELEWDILDRFAYRETFFAFIISSMPG
jgi:hypothetical protein